VPTHVALLRGINLGPHKRVAMPALRTLVESLGHTEVATYIASGNVVFTATGATTTLADELEKAIADELGVTCRVVVLTTDELVKAAAGNPYPDEPDPKRVHAIFLTGPAGAAARKRLDQAREKLGEKVGRDEAEIVFRKLIAQLQHLGEVIVMQARFCLRQLPFESWFFRILSNLFIDLLRRRPKQKPLSLDQPMGDEESEENLLLQIPDEEANPERSLIDQVMDENLQNALNALPDSFRAAVLLCDVEGRSYEEIARIMHSSIGTVRSRIHRGRTLLRRALDSQAAPSKPGRASKKRPAPLLPLAHAA